MRQELFEIAAKAMHVTVSEAQLHWKAIPEYDAYYLWNPVGGIAVIINNKGEKLAATSSVTFERHLKAFLDGRRN